MTAQPTKLNEIKDIFQIDSTYQIKVNPQPEDFIFLVLGFSHDKPGASIQHPAILDRKNRVHEYKHYKANGGKSWTSKAGVDILVAVPRNEVTLLPEKSYSYPKVEIGGQKITFNCSGGGGNIWTDWIDGINHTSTNMPIKKVKAILSKSIPKNFFEQQGQVPLLKDSYEGETPAYIAARNERWHELVAQTQVRKRIISEVESGMERKIVLTSGCTYAGENVFKIIETIRLVKWNGKKCPAKGFIAIGSYGRCKVKFNQIDWLKTAEANNYDYQGNPKAA